MRFLVPAILFVAFSSCNHLRKHMENSADQMPVTEQNKELIRRTYSEMVNKQNYALIDSFFAKDIFDHDSLERQQQGLPGFKKAVSGFLGMFSQINVQIEDILAKRDVVATRETWKVTRKSDNKILTGETMHWFRIKENKITDEWSKGWEWLGL